MSDFQCKNCGYVASHQGAFNLHMYHCNLKHGIRAEKKQPKEVDGCYHSWRLLSPNHSIEKRALENGYTEVCEKCQNVQ